MNKANNAGEWVSGWVEVIKGDKSPEWAIGMVGKITGNRIQLEDCWYNVADFNTISATNDFAIKKTMFFASDTIVKTGLLKHEAELIASEYNAETDVYTSYHVIPSPPNN